MKVNKNQTMFGGTRRSAASFFDVMTPTRSRGLLLGPDFGMSPPKHHHDSTAAEMIIKLRGDPCSHLLLTEPTLFLAEDSSSMLFLSFE